jgi:hypothetical protein
MFFKKAVSPRKNVPLDSDIVAYLAKSNQIAVQVTSVSRPDTFGVIREGSPLSRAVYEISGIVPWYGKLILARISCGAIFSDQSKPVAFGIWGYDIYRHGERGDIPCVELSLSDKEGSVAQAFFQAHQATRVPLYRAWGTSWGSSSAPDGVSVRQNGWGSRRRPPTESAWTKLVQARQALSAWHCPARRSYRDARPAVFAHAHVEGLQPVALSRVQ